MDCGTGVGTTSNKRARVPDVASAAASSSSSTDEAEAPYIELPATAAISLDEPDEQGSMFDEIAQPCEQCGLPMFAGQCLMVNAQTGIAQAVHAVWCPDCQYGTVMTPGADDVDSDTDVIDGGSDADE